MVIYRHLWGAVDLERRLRVRRRFVVPGEGINARIYLYEVVK
jgi:hypothetical protein